MYFHGMGEDQSSKNISELYGLVCHLPSILQVMVRAFEISVTLQGRQPNVHRLICETMG